MLKSVSYTHLDVYKRQTKELITKTRFSIYMKEAEEISNLLALIGANKAVMKLSLIHI